VIEHNNRLVKVEAYVMSKVSFTCTQILRKDLFRRGTLFLKFVLICKLRKLKYIILPDIFCGYDSVYHPKRRHTEGVSESRVLRRVVGQKRQDITVGLRKLYSEELCDLCCS